MPSSRSSAPANQNPIPLEAPFFDGSGSPDGQAIATKLGNLNRPWLGFFQGLGSRVASLAAAVAALLQPPFSDANPLVENAADATKLIQFDASGITTGMTRVATMPDRDITLADQGAHVAGVCSAAITLTSTYADVTGMTVNLTKKGWWKLTAYLVTTLTNGAMEGQILFGATPQSGYIVALNGTLSALQGMQSKAWFVLSVTGAETCKIQAKETGGSVIDLAGDPYAASVLTAEYLHP